MDFVNIVLSVSLDYLFLIATSVFSNCICLPKIGKHMIFWRKIVIFHTKYPTFSRFPPLGAISLRAPPLTLNPGSALAVVFNSAASDTIV